MRGLLGAALVTIAVYGAGFAPAALAQPRPDAAAAARPDAARPDAARPDAGPRDAGPRDAGSRVASPRDAGSRDAGPRDAGPRDAGRRDAGPPLASALGATPGPAAPARAADDHGAPPSSTTGIIVRTLIGLLAILTLAWLGAHPRVQRLEEILGVRQVITAGFAFVALGLIARHPALHILSDDVLERLTPLLHFALGWLGFLMGFQFDVRVLDRMPKGTAATVFLGSSLPFLFVAVAGCGLMLAFGQSWDDARFLRDAVALASAGAIAASRLRSRPPPWDPEHPDRGLYARIDQLDEIAGVIGLAFLSAFFRPSVAFTWDLPGSIWLFITVGMGVAIGLVLYAVVRLRASGSEFLAITLGSVAFCAGMAGYLSLSPIVVCFVAGALLSNLPSESKDRLWAILTRLERPIHLLFLIIAGALWDVTDWRGWVLLPVFVLGRIAGTGLANRVIERQGDPTLPLRPEGRRPLITPISVFSIAIVVSVQWLYRGRAIPWIVTAVIGGAILTEILGQLFERGRASERGKGAPAP